MTELEGAVDYWCNGFFVDREERWRRAIERQGLTLAVGRPGDEFCTPDQMVQRLDESGFDVVIVVVSEPPPAGTTDPNLFEHVALRSAEAAALRTSHPERFRGIWSVDPTGGPASVELAAPILSEPWCVGLLNHTHSWNRRFDHPSFEPFYELCAAHDVPFVMQAGRSGGNFPHECGHPSGIDEPAARHPTVRFVLSHTGWPWTDETIDRASTFDNVYLGTATWPLRRWSPKLLAFAGGAGRSKVLYGSGFPLTGHRQAARQFADPDLTATLDPATVTAISGGNARSVFTRLPRSTTRRSTSEE